MALHDGHRRIKGPKGPQPPVTSPQQEGYKPILPVNPRRRPSQDQKPEPERNSNPEPPPLPRAEEAPWYLTHTVNRVFFGDHLLTADPSEYVNPAHGLSYLVGLGEAPKGAKGTLGLVRGDGTVAGSEGDTVYRKLGEIVPYLRKHGLELEEGPYADDEHGTVDRFTHDLFGDIAKDNIPRHFAAIVALARDKFAVRAQDGQGNPLIDIALKEDIVTPLDFRSPAGLLSQEQRRKIDTSNGKTLTLSVHRLELPRLLVAALRRRGYQAYPVLAPVNLGGEEIYVPMLATVDLSAKSKFPLHLSSQLGSFPSVGSIDILSDQAMLGATHIFVAEARAKQLRKEMLAQFEEGRRMSVEEILHHLDKAAEDLFECYRRWPASFISPDSGEPTSMAFISRSAEFIESTFGSAIFEIMKAEYLTNYDQIVEANPVLAMPGALEEDLHQTVGQSVAGYMARFGGYLQSMIVSVSNQLIAQFGTREE